MKVTNRTSSAVSAWGMKGINISLWAKLVWLLLFILFVPHLTQSQTQNNAEVSPAISGELKRIILRHSVNHVDLRGVGAAEDLIVQAYAENGFMSAPTFTMLLIHQNKKSGHDYILVDMPPIPVAGNFYTTNAISANCFLVDSSFFTSDANGQHVFMIRAVRELSYGKSKISIDAYRLDPIKDVALSESESLYRFVRVASAVTKSRTCSLKELRSLEQKLLNIQFKE